MKRRIYTSLAVYGVVFALAVGLNYERIYTWYVLNFTDRIAFTVP